VRPVSLLDRLSAPPGRPRERRDDRAVPDLASAGAGVLLVVLAWALGGWLTAHGADVHAPTPPLYAGYGPHYGPGTPAALVLAALVVLRGPGLAAALGWRRLLLAGYLASLAWTFALALIQGWQVGVAGRLTVPSEYLHEVHPGMDLGAFLRTFTTHILAFQPGSFTTHVAAHPPLTVLLFVLMDRIGLGGGGPAGVLCILVGASAPVAVAITLRALGGAGGERLARSALPFGVLVPAAIWVGVSADGMYAGVLAWAVCTFALAIAQRRRNSAARSRAALAALSGLLFGCCLYFSYGLALAGLFPLAVLLLTRRAAPIVIASVGVAAVVAAFTASGFWWFSGYQRALVLYAQPMQLGSADRSYGYWVWAAPAAFAVALGPATVAGLRRMLAAAPRARSRGAPIERRVLTALCGAALLAVLVADLTGLSRGETERIWLPFAMWLVPAAGLLPARHARWWLLAQALVALAVNHLLIPPW
jgi:methylthioxylose transferase